MKCPECQTENSPDSRFCTHCGTSLNIAASSDEGMRVRTSSTVKRYAQGKDPTLAAILSLFIPGAGQFYNGDTLKGVVMLVGAFILLSIIKLAYLAICIWAIIDAYQVAKGNQSLWS